MKYESVAIVGPTASGKTTRAVSLSGLLNGEVISGDSRQVYRSMDLGTGKDLEEYEGIPYHLIDICDAGEKYNLYRFIADFNRVYSEIKERGKFPVICGGSGMYVETALSGISLPEVPENKELRLKLEGLPFEELVELLKRYKTLHNTTDIDTRKRVIRAIEIEKYYIENPGLAFTADRSKSKPLNSLIIGVEIPREERRHRISQRLLSRLENGMVDEVRKLLDSGIKAEDLIYYGLEYKFLTLYILGELGYEEMVEKLEIAIHQFAKRQMTWFRGMEKRGFRINWIPFDLDEKDFNERVLCLLD